jgi:predicted DNA-binding transcriptional regulator YafY
LRISWDKELRENHYPNATKIANKFEISAKTAQRDLDFLRDRLKLPIEYSAKHRGWYYTESIAYKLSLINIFEGELVALLLAEKLAKQYRGLAIEKKLQKAFNKILLAASDKISVDLAALSEAYSFEANLSPELNYETLEVLEQAIRENKSLKMLYFTAQSGSMSTRKVHPYHLRNFQGEWYLIAFDDKRQDIRVFLATRIQELKLLEETFTKPNDFDLKNYLQDGFSMIRGNQKFDVELVFDEYQSRWIRERSAIHPTEKRTQLPNGELKIHLQVTNLDGIKRFVMQYGSHVKVIKPPELQQQILTEIKAMLEFYQ